MSGSERYHEVKRRTVSRVIEQLVLLVETMRRRLGEKIKKRRERGEGTGGDASGYEVSLVTTTTKNVENLGCGGNDLR